jgi:putative transposase
MPLCKLYYHFVWATHDRLPLITVDRETSLYQFIHHKTHELGGRIHAIGGIEDHLHLIVSTPPSLALSDYVRLVKGSSARYMNTHYSANIKFAWQNEYGVFSISPKNLDRAIAYAHNQKSHHAENTIFPHLEPDVLPQSKHLKQP